MLPFLCECADLSCTTVVPLTGHEYEAVRGNPTHFVNAPGHVVNARGWGRVVADHGRYTVVEKIGEAAEVVVAYERGERTA